MKTCKNFITVVFFSLLLAVGLTACQEDDLPQANTSLSYPSGEMALGGGTYISAQPTVLAPGIPEFSVTGITHNGAEADLGMVSIHPTSGIINITTQDDMSALGEYLVSVDMTVDGQVQHYADALKLTVKGILFPEAKMGVMRGEESTISIKEAYLAQKEGTKYTLVLPKTKATVEDYKHFSLDTLTCDLKVAATAEAGIYPISIKVENATNPEGVVFENVMTLVVESKPYNLVYEPNNITLIPMEGHVSPTPSVKAASKDEGDKVTYELLDDHSGAFSIDAQTGAISLKEDSELVQQVAQTFALQVKVTNAHGTTSFPEAYSITVDPTKKAEPITVVTYTDSFPVELQPAEAWTSQRPQVTGSTVGIKWSLKNAPQGVSIDPKTGIITFVEGHSMPLKMVDNTITVQVQNQGMTEPFEVQLGDFAINPTLWTVAFKKNASAESLSNSGLANMDRHSYSGQICTNGTKVKPSAPYLTDQGTATTNQVKNAWGKGKNPNAGEDVVDFCGLGLKFMDKVPEGCTNQNNDWVVTDEVKIPSAENISAVLSFYFSSQFGKDEENYMEVYIVEVNEQNVYEAGDHMDDTKGMNYQPSNLTWRILGTTDAEATTPGAALIKANHDLSGSGSSFAKFPMELREFDISDYRGKTVRIGFRVWNPQPGDLEQKINENQRTFHLKNIQVEARLVK